MIYCRRHLILLTWAFMPRERAEGVTAGGSVYLRSQPSAAAKERPGETVQGRGMIYSGEESMPY